jgi:hypothetical protein
LTTLYLVDVKNTDSWRARKGDLQCAFPLDVSMVLSSAIAIAADGESLTCDGFSLGKTVCLRNYVFIADYFGGLSLSPRRGDEGATFTGSTHSRASTPWRAMIEDSANKFLMASSGEGSFGLPYPRRRDTGASLTPTTTTPWMENALATEAMMTVPSRMAAPWLETNLPIERRHKGQQAQVRAWQPTAEQARWQVGRYHGSTTCAAMARAHA